MVVCLYFCGGMGCSVGGVFVVVFLWWCVCIFAVVWGCSCGGVFVVVFLWWCSLWWCFCGGVLAVVFLWWCGVVLE